MKETGQSKDKESGLAASPEEVKASRLTPGRVRRLREKLGISQRELGALVGATLGAVASWEKGKFRPRGEKKAALVGLRKVGKGDVKKMLAEKAGKKDKGETGKRPKEAKGGIGGSKSPLLSAFSTCALATCALRY
jgi:DNA-binding transcriptional regulator YiaG